MALRRASAAAAREASPEAFPGFEVQGKRFGWGLKKLLCVFSNVEGLLTFLGFHSPFRVWRFKFRVGGLDVQGFGWVSGLGVGFRVLGLTFGVKRIMV